MDLESIPQSLVDYAVKKGADDVVVSAGRGTRKQLRFANSEPTIAKSWESVAAEIFIAKDKKLVHTSVNDFSVLEATVDSMMSMMAAMKENSGYKGIAQGDFPYQDHGFDRHIRDIDQGLAEYAGMAIEAAAEAGAKRTAGVLYSNHGQYFQATSGGSSGSHQGAYIEISVRAFSSKDASGHSVQSVPKLDEFDPAMVGREAGEMAAKSLNPKIGDTGRFKVLFTPLSFANFLERCASASSAGMVEAGMSFFKDKVGQKLGPEFLRLTDDATDSSSIGSAPFDQEGVPTRKNVVFEDGVLKGLLHNTSTAARFGTETTANSGLVFPHAWNLSLEPGDISPEEMISSIKDGIYVTNLWYTRFQNYQTGDFSTIPRDAIFRIRDGELAEPLKDIRISENMLDLLSNIKMVGNDPRWIHWWEVEMPISTPHVLVDNVNITRSTQ